MAVQHPRSFILCTTVLCSPGDGLVPERMDAQREGQDVPRRRILYGLWSREPQGISCSSSCLARMCSLRLLQASKSFGYGVRGPMMANRCLCTTGLIDYLQGKWQLNTSAGLNSLVTFKRHRQLTAFELLFGRPTYSQPHDMEAKMFTRPCSLFLGTSASSRPKHDSWTILMDQQPHWSHWSAGLIFTLDQKLLEVMHGCTLILGHT